MSEMIDIPAARPCITPQQLRDWDAFDDVNATDRTLHLAADEIERLQAYIDALKNNRS
jgi:hypothetical protein